MIYKKVKRIDEQISALGVGCWNFGGDWDSSEDNNSDRIIHASIDLGINLFDVAPVYGWYHSEEVLGKALQGGLRQKVVIASKCGLLWDENHKTRNCLTKKSILEEIDGSLRRLRTAQFQSVRRNKAVQRHVLALKGCDTIAVPGKDPTERRHQKAFPRA